MTKRFIVLLAAAALLVIFVPVLRQLMTQILWGYALMGVALPLCRVFEKKLSPGPSAALSLLALGGSLILMVTFMLPTVLRQGQQVLSVLPQWWQRFSPYFQTLPFENLAQAGAGLLKRLSGMAGSLGRLMLSPALAFYFLRDRQSISRALCLWVPLGLRSRTVMAAREARRELAGFLRGQVLISLCVGGLTALGLGLARIPAWLVLGLLMGVMELIPYLGPLLATVPVVIFALPQGMVPTLWALGVVLVVQQLEGNFLSPRLLATATRLHPAWVLLIISLGGMTAGVPGMLLSLPLAVALRGAIRGLMR
ncbi:MAG: AI-2E family transporter [Clostridia bacterium]|nr:AI-2E family transporter [Clostridia bacterium]